MTDTATKTPPRPAAQLSIGRARDIVRRATDISVTNIAVRTSDRDAFLGIIHAREAQLAKPTKTVVDATSASVEIGRLSRAIIEDQAGDGSPQQIVQNLENVAAHAIAMLADLKGRA